MATQAGEHPLLNSIDTSTLSNIITIHNGQGDFQKFRYLWLYEGDPSVDSRVVAAIIEAIATGVTGLIGIATTRAKERENKELKKEWMRYTQLIGWWDFEGWPVDTLNCHRIQVKRA